MSFKKEGYIDVTITEAYVGECRFTKDEGKLNEHGEQIKFFGEVCLVVEDSEGNNDTWYGELSNRLGVGTVAHLYQYDLTLKSLQDIGFNVQNMTELMAQFDTEYNIPNIIGFQATVYTENKEYTKKDGTKGSAIRVRYLNALGGGRKRMTSDKFAAMQQAFSQPPQQQFAPPPQQYAQVAPAPAPQGQYAPPPVQQPAQQGQGQVAPPPVNPYN